MSSPTKSPGPASDPITPDWLPEWWPQVVLAGGMLLSAVVALWFGRPMFFTGDELSIISLVAEIEPRELIEPYVGHLMPVSFLAYRLVLELAGTGEYAAFQVMTLLAIFLLGAMVFLWGRKRIPAAIAVAPALMLLIFPQDFLHYFAGNGFVIVFALATGLAALYAFERGDRVGDIASFVLLCIGMMTYTVAVAFAIGVLVATLLERDWKRLWVAGVPLILYAIWRVTIASASGEVEDVGPDWANVFLIPAWFFQSIGFAAATLSGLGFDFLAAGSEAGNTSRPALALAPVLGVLILGAIAVAIGRGRNSRGLLVVVAVALALTTSQALVWGTFGARGDPTEPRYLYPGALVVVMIAIELGSRVRWDLRKAVVVWVVALAALGSAISLARTSSKRENVTGKIKAEVLAVDLLQGTKTPPPISDQPRFGLRKSYDAIDGTKFGYLGFTERQITGRGRKWAPVTDQFLARSERVGLRPVPPGVQARACRRADRVGSDETRIYLPPDGAILESTRILSPMIGRYAQKPTVSIGQLDPGRKALLRLEPDRGTRPWFLVPGPQGSLADIVVCGYRKAR